MPRPNLRLLDLHAQRLERSRAEQMMMLLLFGSIGCLAAIWLWCLYRVFLTIVY